MKKVRPGVRIVEKSAVGTGGTALHFDGSSWSAVDSKTDRTLRSIWGASPEDVWVVGDAGRILHYDGLTLESVPVPDHPEVNHLAVWGRTPSDIWIGGDKGTVRRFDGVTVTTLLYQPDVTNQFGDRYEFWVPSVWGGDPTNMQHWNECVLTVAGAQRPCLGKSRCGKYSVSTISMRRRCQKTEGWALISRE